MAVTAMLTAAIAAMQPSLASTSPSLSDPTCTEPGSVCVETLAFRFLPGEDYVTVHRGLGVPWPAPLSVTRGSKLFFVNKDLAPHTLTYDGCPLGHGFALPAPLPGPAAALIPVFDGVLATAFGSPPLPHPAGGCLFDSRGRNPNGFTNTGGSVLVDTSQLRSGRYKFYCVIHHFMQGTLLVTT